MFFDNLFRLNSDHVNEVSLEDLFQDEKNILPTLNSGEFIEFFDFGNEKECCIPGINLSLIKIDDSMLNEYIGNVANSTQNFSGMCQEYKKKYSSPKVSASGSSNKNGNHSRVRIKFGNEDKKKPSIYDINQLASELIEAIDYMNYCNKLYMFDGRIWVSLSLDSFKTHVMEYIDRENHESMSMTNIKELYDRVKCSPEIQQDQEAIRPDPKYLCFRNGVFDLYEEKLLPHNPYFKFFSFIDEDFKYTPTCGGMVFEAFINKMSNGISCIRERFLDVAAFCMSDYSNIKAIPLLVGDRNSGKTTFANLISMIVGHENCVSISLGDFDKWATASLVGKKVCLSTDLPNIKLSKNVTGILKQLSGGDLVKAEEKGRNPFSFFNSCKILLASNYMPQLSENDNALKDRWVVVPFLHSLSEDEINHNLLSDLERELPYIIYICTLQLRKLMLNNFRFTDIGDYEDCFEADGKYIDLDQDVIIKDFIENCCIIHPQSKALVSELYQRYQDFCFDQYELTPISSISFSKALRRLLSSSIKDGGHANGRSLIGIGLVS